MSVLCWNTDSSIYWKHFANSCQSHLLLIFTLSALCSFNLCAHQCGLVIQIITIWAIRPIKLVLIITYNSFSSARRGAPFLLVVQETKRLRNIRRREKNVIKTKTDMDTKRNWQPTKIKMDGAVYMARYKLLVRDLATEIKKMKNKTLTLLYLDLD
jgi:hypothetical protein